MSALAFLSPDLASTDARYSSPLERALAHAPAGIEDVSRSGKLEVRGDVDAINVAAEIVRITSERALVICEPERTADLRETVSDEFTVYDVSAAYAGLRVRGAGIVRRVTDLDLEALPAFGSLAHVQALILADGDETFRIYVPQEYGHYVAEVVIDAARGVAQ